LKQDALFIFISRPNKQFYSAANKVKCIFCSEYGYNYGFNGSDSEDISDEEEQTKKKVIRKIRNADSNITDTRYKISDFCLIK
jgi:hypothetical protein